mgnify:CR=1 FL=1
MKTFIKKLKNQDDELKNKSAKVLAIISTLIIVVIWAVLTSLFVKPTTVVQEESPVAPDIKEFLNQAGAQFGDIADSVETARDTLVNIPQEIEEQEVTESNE